MTWLFGTPVSVPVSSKGVNAPVDDVTGPMKVLPSNVPDTPVADVWPVSTISLAALRTWNVPSGLTAMSFQK
jgi:hypothetical protein